MRFLAVSLLQDVLCSSMSTCHKLGYMKWENLNWENCFVRYSHRSFLSAWWRRAQPIKGGTIPGLLALSSIRKQAKQAKNNKPVSSTTPWPLYQLLHPGSCLAWLPVLNSLSDGLLYGSISQTHPFLLEFILVMVFHYSNRNPKTNRDRRRKRNPGERHRKIF